MFRLSRPQKWYQNPSTHLTTVIRAEFNVFLDRSLQRIPDRMSHRSDDAPPYRHR